VLSDKKVKLPRQDIRQSSIKLTHTAQSTATNGRLTSAKQNMP